MWRVDRNSIPAEKPVRVPLMRQTGLIRYDNHDDLMHHLSYIEVPLNSLSLNSHTFSLDEEKMNDEVNLPLVFANTSLISRRLAQQETKQWRNIEILRCQVHWWSTPQLEISVSQFAEFFIQARISHTIRLLHQLNETALHQKWSNVLITEYIEKNAIYCHLTQQIQWFRGVSSSISSVESIISMKDAIQSCTTPLTLLSRIQFEK